MIVKTRKPWHFWGRKQNNEDFVYDLSINTALYILFKLLVISAETSVYLAVLAPNCVFTRGAFDVVGMDFNIRCRNHICVY